MYYYFSSVVWIRRMCHAWKFPTFPQTGAESEVLWRLFEGYVKPPCDPRWLGSLTLFFWFSGGCLKVTWRFVWPVLTRLSALLLLKQKKLVCIFLFPVKPNTHLPSHTAPTLIDICDRSGTQLLHSELIFQIEFKWWSWCRINSVVQRPLRATAWTRLYLASQPDSQPTVHAPCHDPGRGHGSECLPNGFGSRGHGVWLFVNSLPDKKFKTCSRNIYAQIILSNEITFHESGQMIFLFVRIRIKSFIAKRWADLQH